MTVHVQVPAAATAAQASLTTVQVPLCDLGLAPENLRFHEPEDDDIPRLAETIRAAGVIYPPIVRRGRKGEQAFMVLDGRRRRFALLRLAAAGAIAPDAPVNCLLAEGKAAQAAAAILPNAETAPVHLADVIAAIGKLRKAKLATGAIAAALGYDELEVKRLEAVAHVHPDVLVAYRQARLSLRQVKLFARLKDKARQGELARQALSGYFHEHGLEMLVTRGRVTVEDERFALVAEAAYGAVGGRLGTDLFGELPAEVLDPDRLEDLWRAAAVRIARGLTEAGLEVSVARERGFRAPDGLDHMPEHYGRLPKDLEVSVDAANDALEALCDRFAEAAPEDRETILGEVLDARLALARLLADGGEVLAALLTPSPDGLDVTFFQRPPVADATEALDGEDEDDDPAAEAGERAPWRPDVADLPTAVDVAGVSHGQHAARTAMATRGLAADLADKPGVALIALTAQLFKGVALNSPCNAETSALHVVAVGGRRDQALAGVDAEVWGKLAAWREAYLAAGGGRPLAYVAGLPGEEVLELLAALVAVTLDLKEGRTTSLRRAARAEAEEIASLCGADLSRRWTPDAAFLSLHSRAQLLAFLRDMGATQPRKPLKKDELVRLVAEAAAKRRWIPACLRWGVEVAETLAGEAGGEASDLPGEGEVPTADAVDADAGEAEPAAAQAA